MDRSLKSTTSEWATAAVIVEHEGDVPKYKKILTEHIKEVTGIDEVHYDIRYNASAEVFEMAVAVNVTPPAEHGRHRKTPN